MLGLGSIDDADGFGGACAHGVIEKSVEYCGGPDGEAGDRSDTEGVKVLAVGPMLKSMVWYHRLALVQPQEKNNLQLPQSKPG